MVMIISFCNISVSSLEKSSLSLPLFCAISLFLSIYFYFSIYRSNNSGRKCSISLFLLMIISFSNISVRSLEKSSAITSLLLLSLPFPLSLHLSFFMLNFSFPLFLSRSSQKGQICFFSFSFCNISLSSWDSFTLFLFPFLFNCSLFLPFFFFIEIYCS